MQIYDTYAEALRPALAQSMAIIFFILLTIVSVAQVRYSKSKEVEI
jgi:raffinose/stachyose/melibiose transport system permease protein